MPHAPATTAPPSADTTRDSYGVLWWLVGGTFIVILNETIMMNAIPRLMVEFDVTARAAQWLSTSFMLTMAVGHSDELEPLDAIAIAIEQCREALGGTSPQAALLLASFASFDPSVVEAIRRAFPGIHVVGSTSGGEVSSVAGFLEYSFVETTEAMHPMYVIRALGGLLFFAGSLIMAWNVYKTITSSEAEAVPAGRPQLAPAE